MALPLLLPSEIWEQILCWLPLKDLLTAACVSNQWRHLARGICRRRCQRLPPRLLEELLEEQVSSGKVCVRGEGKGEADWLKVSRMLLQTHITSTPQDCRVDSQLSDVVLLFAAARFLVMVRRRGEDQSCTLSLVHGLGRVTSDYVLPGKVNKVCVVEGGSQGSVLAVSVNKELVALLVPLNTSSITPIPVTPALVVDSRLCCDGRTMVVSQNEENYQLSVYTASVLPSRLQLVLRSHIRTMGTSPPVCWDFWNGFVTTLVPSGHVLTYTVEGSLVAKSPFYKDLRYPNPMLLSRGLVFISTITSRTMLSYWHMDRDRDYWLVGESVLTSWVQRGPHAVGNTCPRPVVEGSIQVTPSSSVGLSSTHEHMVSCQQEGSSSSSNCVMTLSKTRVGATMMLDVTAVHYQRGLLFCGTTQGYLLVYKLLEATGHREAGPRWEVLEMCMPSLCISLYRRPLARLAVCFVGASVLVTTGDRDGNRHIVSIPTCLPST